MFINCIVRDIISTFEVKERHMDEDVMCVFFIIIYFPYMCKLYSKVWYEFSIFCRKKKSHSDEFHCRESPRDEGRERGSVLVQRTPVRWLHKASLPFYFSEIIKPLVALWRPNCGSTAGSVFPPTVPNLQCAGGGGGRFKGLRQLEKLPEQ